MQTRSIVLTLLVVGIVVGIMSTMKLNIPTPEQHECIVKEFMSDLKSYSYKNMNGEECPIICGVCDGMPQKEHWFEWVPVLKMKSLCLQYGMMHENMKEYYPEQLIQEYQANHPDLHGCVLSPKSQIMNDEIIICKSCHQGLKKNTGNPNLKKPPQQSIANAYLIGEAPVELTRLNTVELAIVSRVRIYSQCWTFFAGCHKHIKGWHTFFKNQHQTTIAHLNLLGTSTMKNNLLVVLCGPFTKEQDITTREAVKVNILWIQEAIGWLIKNNYHYKDDKIPTEAEIPVPIILDENQTGMSIGWI
jgi:hypothetical protein